jgi:diaminohydroxyphosphoribosylaminopyrimidine deaminase/5-amino-6-(5-phosphoribosylamino)uracil reductase
VQTDERFMRRALRLARRGLGRTSPNPVVGSVVVRDGELVAEGWHGRAGQPHAEVIALEIAGDRAAGATLYTTLEPCVHVGRTPPCLDAVLAARVARVVVAVRDPDPRVDGRGIARLRESGLEVTEGVLADEARAQNRPFFKHVRARLPWVLLKLALSLDGRATAPGRRYLTGPQARRRVHQLRDELDAVLVGVGTVLADDPLLTVRDVRGRDPLRVIVDSEARTPPTARVIGSDGRALLFVREGADAARVGALREAGARVVEVSRAEGGVDLVAAMRWLDAHDVLSVLLEGGPTLASAMLRAGLVDEALFLYAPLVVGDAGLPALAGRLETLTLREARAFRLGEDLAVRGLLPPD